MALKNIITQVLTEYDNQTHDAVRWLSVLCVLTGLGLAIYATITSKPFDLQAFGIGAGAMIGSLGFSVKRQSAS